MVACVAVAVVAVVAVAFVVVVVVVVVVVLVAAVFVVAVVVVLGGKCVSGRECLPSSSAVCFAQGSMNRSNSTAFESRGLKVEGVERLPHVRSSQVLEFPLWQGATPQ